MVKVILILVVIAVLLEDSTSIKKSVEEVKEEEELAERVNATLAEEKRKEDEEKRREDKKKKKIEDEIKGRKEDVDEKKDFEDKDEACPPVNVSCPVIEPCQPCQDCKVCQNCPPEKECPEIKKCGPCPTVKPCKPCLPVDCHPCGPRPNLTESSPSTCQCPEGQDLAMTIPVAMAVGAAASLLVIGVATAVGLVIRYVSPMFSGLLFISIIVLTWYLSSHYPGTARELGGRAATLLREAATTLSHRIMAAIRHHNDQVGFSITSTSLKSSNLSSKFPIEKFALRFSM
jgi:hypothetical protein